MSQRLSLSTSSRPCHVIGPHAPSLTRHIRLPTYCTKIYRYDSSVYRTLRTMISHGHTPVVDYASAAPDGCLRAVTILTNPRIQFSLPLRAVNWRLIQNRPKAPPGALTVAGSIPTHVGWSRPQLRQNNSSCNSWSNPGTGQRSTAGGNNVPKSVPRLSRCPEQCFRRHCHALFLCAAVRINTRGRDG